MSECQSFNFGNPENDEQKLVVDLVHALQETLQVFCNRNKSRFPKNVLVPIVQGAIGFTAMNIKLFYSISKDPQDVKDKSIETFLKYMDDIK